MPDLFISYSRRDKVFAPRLYERLEAANIECWVDWDGIPFGVEWEAKILSSIDASRAFLAIITPESLLSEVCHREIKHARQQNKRIIPLMRRSPDMQIVAGQWYGKSWETIARDNWKHIDALNWVQLRKKHGEAFNCSYDPITDQVTNPDCDGAASDADDFETAIEQILKTLEDDYPYLDMHARIYTRALSWKQNKGALLSGIELQDAEYWLITSGTKTPNPTDLHREFIRASRKALDTQTRYRTAIMSAFVVVLLVVIGLIVYHQMKSSGTKT